MSERNYTDDCLGRVYLNDKKNVTFMKRTEFDAETNTIKVQYWLDYYNGFNFEYTHKIIKDDIEVFNRVINDYRLYKSIENKKV